MNKITILQKILLIFALNFAFTVSADTIVKKDGTVLNVYNVEEAGKWILYTESPDNQDALKRIPIDQVFGIKVGDKELEPVGKVTQQMNTQTSSENTVSTDGIRLVPTNPSYDNAQIINELNNIEVSTSKSPKNSIRAHYNSSLWGISSNSVISDSLLTIHFKRTKFEFSTAGLIPGVEDAWGYRFMVENKSGKPLYVDLTNSFFVDPTNQAIPFFENKSYTSSSGGNTGVGVNMGSLTSAVGIGGTVGTIAGGINVGGSKVSGNSVIENEQPVIIIPPYSSVYLPCKKMKCKNDLVDLPYVFYLWNSNRTSTWKEDWCTTYCYLRNQLYKGVINNDEINITATEVGIKDNDFVWFDEQNSPKKYKIIISYSENEQFKIYSQMITEIYLRGLFGDRIEKNKKVTISNDRLIHGVADLKK